MHLGIQLKALVVSSSAEQLRLWQRLFGELRIEVEVSRSAASAAEKLARGKYEAVVVDYDNVSGAGGLLMGVRSAPTSHHAVVFAVVNSAARIRQVAGFEANFVLAQPLNPEWVARCLRAAHASMLADQRRYFRHPVDIPVLLQSADRQLAGRITNISEGGLGLWIRELDACLKPLQVRFDLPGCGIPITAGVVVAWSDGKGRAGAHFQDMLPSKRAALRDWLAERFADAGEKLVSSAG